MDQKVREFVYKIGIIDVESFGDGSMSQYPKHHLNRGMSTPWQAIVVMRSLQKKLKILSRETTTGTAQVLLLMRIGHHL
jgi:hypothetical protein